MPAVAAGRTKVSGPVQRRASLHEQHFPGAATSGTSSNLTFSINRPTEYGSNPIWPTLASTAVDKNIGYIGTRDAGAVTELFYTAWNNVDVGTYVQECYATSLDGPTINRPTLGYYTYPPLGTTANNIIQPNYPTYARGFTKIVFDDYSQKYVAIGSYPAGLPMSMKVMTSRNKVSWTTEKDISDPTGTQYCEPMCFWRRSDNRAVIYYQAVSSGHASYGGLRRHVGMMLGPSDGTLTGTWTNTGTILTAPSDDVQYYQTGVHRDGELCWVMASIFDGTNSVPAEPTFSGTVNRIHKISLYTTPSNDGATLTSRDATWLNTSGVYGEWDGGEIIAPCNFARRGDTWNVYVGGDGNTHHQATESDRLMGLYSIGHRRIGQATATSPTGTWTSDLLTDPGQVFVNKSNGGTVTVELLDWTNTPITNYTSADCSTIPSDVYDWGVKWGSTSLTPSAFRVKVYVSGGAYLHHVDVRAA